MTTAKTRIPQQRYKVIERIEAGGMAEVFVGEAESLEGFKKQVAIKRVLPHLAQNKKFIQMFLDEARLGARLNHANIVSVFDIGAADNTYFIVMEFVDGANLKTVIETLRRQGRRFPLKEALYIAYEATRGLSYAHELADAQGRLIGVVHRDISPPNILITKRGEVKLADFGLAKASTQLEKTDPGVVKGKFSYLAPEGASGNEVDARADIFALGIVIWEMLAGRRLFLGETEFQTVKLVQQANVPSVARLNPEVSPELEPVLQKALARRPEERYQSAREFGDALADYLFRNQMKVTEYDLARLVQDVVAEREREKKPQQASVIDRLIQEELLHFTSIEDGGGSGDISKDAPVSRERRESEGARPLSADDFENPQEWFKGDDDLIGSFPPSGPAWREVGLDSKQQPLPVSDSTGPHELARELEGSGPVAAPPARAEAAAARAPSTPPSRTPSVPAMAATPQSVRPVEAPRAAAAQPPPLMAAPAPASGGGGALKLVLAGVALLVLAGAVLWFSGVLK
ncbi:MAG: serine/threonine protein kinase [Deltaproteobacteria bacterium]|nr:serine/threonine protein kinase [Deltaproteobacteria bacterium]